MNQRCVNRIFQLGLLRNMEHEESWICREELRYLPVVKYSTNFRESEKILGGWKETGSGLKNWKRKSYKGWGAWGRGVPWEDPARSEEQVGAKLNGAWVCSEPEEDLAA